MLKIGTNNETIDSLGSLFIMQNYPFPSHQRLGVTGELSYQYILFSHKLIPPRDFMELTKTDIQMQYSKEKTYIQTRCMEEYLDQALEILI